MDDKTLGAYKYFLNGHTDGQALLALEDVIKSGLSPEILETAQVRIFDGNTKTLKERLGQTHVEGLSLMQSCKLIEFPYTNRKGDIILYRYKIVPTIYDKHNDPIKYKQQKDTHHLPYILPHMWDIQKKPHKPIWFTEGEKKTLALIQHNRNCIGLPGVWGFKAGKKSSDLQSKDLWSDIKLFYWSGRRTYLAFDQDWTGNPGVRDALYLLAFQLKLLKADVRFATWAGAKGKGIDDLLYSCREDDTEQILTDIEKQAKNLEGFIEEAHLNEVMYALTKTMSDSDSIIEAENIKSIVSRKLKLRPGKIDKEIKHRQQKAKEQHETISDVKKGDKVPLDPYRINDDGSVVIIKNTNGKEVTQHLANFSARISEQVYEDNGLETAMRFVITGHNKAREFPKIKISSNKFLSLNWPLDFWGNDARIEVGTNIKDHFRYFVQLYSDVQGIENKRVFTHTGWRHTDQGWVYLCANGAIGGEGIEVELPGEFREMGRYCLPSSPDNEIDAIKASLSFLELGARCKKEITYPTYFYTFLAPLTSILKPIPNFSAYFYGETGSFKSTIATLLLSHFGDFAINNLSNFESTANQIEKRAFTLKDTLYILDDLHPAARQKEAMAKEAIAQRLIFSSSNRSGRERLNPDASEKAKYVPRGMLLITGEEIVQLPSSLARVMVIEFNSGDIDINKLSVLQKNSGLLPHAMTSYILWIRDNIDMIQQSFTSAFPELRSKTNAKMEAAHKKIGEQFVYLRFTLDLVMTWARQKNAISLEDVDRITQAAEEVFQNIAFEQAERVSEEDPAKLFLTKLSDLLTQGLVRLEWRYSNDNPKKVADTDKTDNNIVGGPSGVPIGYFDHEFYYFIPGAMWDQVKYQYTRIGEHFPFSHNTLYKMLEKKGYIESEKGKHTFSIKVRTFNKRLVKFKRSNFNLSSWDPKAADDGAEGSIV